MPTLLKRPGGFLTGTATGTDPSATAGLWSGVGLSGSASPTGSPSASSFGVSPFSAPRFDFSKGVPAALLGAPLVSANGGAIFDSSNSNPNSYGSKFGEQNANSAYIKFGTSDPAATQASKTPVPLDTAASLAAGGGNLTWDSLHGGWSIVGGTGPSPGARGGPNYASSPLYAGSTQSYRDRYQTALDYLNNVSSKPIGTPALNQLNQLNASRQKLPANPWARG